MIEKLNGSPVFYAILEKMRTVHHKKSHDYASNNMPYGNYEFAGKLGQLFNNSNDAGFLSRIGEKLYRLANIENNNKTVLNESIEDTEIDLCTIVTLWMASRMERRAKNQIYQNEMAPDKVADMSPNQTNEAGPSGGQIFHESLDKGKAIQAAERHAKIVQMGFKSPSHVFPLVIELAETLSEDDLNTAINHLQIRAKMRRY